MNAVLRQHAEEQFAEELHELQRQDRYQRPPNWQLSPWAVAHYLLGGKLENGFVISPKYIGNRRLIETAGAGVEIPGAAAPLHTYWVFTVLSNRPDELVADLRAPGFDATRVATMSALPAPADRPELEPRESRALLARLVYLPVYPELRRGRIEEMATIVRRHCSASRPVEETEPSRARIA